MTLTPPPTPQLHLTPSLGHSAPHAAAIAAAAVIVSFKNLGSLRRDKESRLSPFLVVKNNRPRIAYMW
ncbi:predicted protein [Plenodomus lingam JN3]|uniref:Predicted protein n=1 Tax=Leptosphaeria maculans (strain JN3 / isolate v23.1.3 / race Av1-4-5-6-7-8) TaxID=985895 RepID=E5AFN9_LEPMJ|nr:predicted protein [Plenodomus lingam JN3]CBY02028.1 predicted protein [Plenodomus lingam JN3]